ncbi:MAG: hypothetical protein LH605_12220 [Microbacteriaceae bacterium]|nr:hypothetical protein [Microbacteriaceae bacterium]
MAIRRGLSALLVGALIAMGLVVTAGSDPDPEPAAAADSGLFDPGYIIADHVFSDSAAMSVAQIQSFLDARVPVCKASTGPTCLRFYSTTSTSRNAVAGRCAAYTGRANESAASIIQRVGVACGINPMVLLVLLEKEQGLVRSTAPTATKYKIATGFGCPDTAACDTKYYGFFNQLYSAAYQFKVYATTPTLWSIRAGRTNDVRLHPNANCGTKSVYVRNQATASLYIYTPYTPNAAAMTNLYGTGDACSSYGNRNFWRIFSDWFGSPTGNGSPYGVVANVTAGYGSAKVRGWAVDPDSRDSIRVHVYVDGVGAANVPADIETPQLAGRLGAGNTNHGFETTLTGLSPGVRSVCTFGINVGTGSNTLLDCRSVTVPAGNPFGIVDQVAAYTGKVYARGWALDPDTSSPVTVRMLVDSKVVAEQVASKPKAGLDAAYPGFGADHGFEFAADGISPGEHRVCLQAVNVGAGVNTTIGCRDVTMRSGSPLLWLDEASLRSPGTLTLRGWAIDPDVVDPVRVHVYVDGQLADKFTADAPKKSLATVFYGFGANHSFTKVLTGLAPGDHEVCVIAIGIGLGGNSTQCRVAVAPSGSPITHIDQRQGTGIGSITLRGWSIDPDVVDPVSLSVYVDGALSATVVASDAKPSLGTAFPGYGDAHAFSTVLKGIAPGAHEVCVRANNVGGGSTTSLCSAVMAYSGPPLLHLDEVSAAATDTIRVRGWAIDPDTVDPVRIHVYVDGVLKDKVTADVPKASLAEVFRPFGADHAFSVSIGELPPGERRVCIFAVNVAGGSDAAQCWDVSLG